MLHTPTHLYKVSQNVSAGVLVGLDVHEPHSDQEVPAKSANDSVRLR